MHLSLCDDNQTRLPPQEKVDITQLTLRLRIKGKLSGCALDEVTGEAQFLIEAEVNGRLSTRVYVDCFSLCLRMQRCSLILLYLLSLDHELHLALADIVEIVAFNPMLAAVGLHPR